MVFCDAHIYDAHVYPWLVSGSKWLSPNTMSRTHLKEIASVFQLHA